MHSEHSSNRVSRMTLAHRSRIVARSAVLIIGASLRLEKLARSGARSLAAGFASWIVLLGLGLGLVCVAGLSA
jgi:hypothetical protein